MIGYGRICSERSRGHGEVFSVDVPMQTVTTVGVRGQGAGGGDWYWLWDGTTDGVSSMKIGESASDDGSSGKPPYRVPSMAEIAAVPHNGFSAVSTFSGCGGSSLGYRMAGFRMLWANEFIPAAQECYRANMSSGTILDTRDIREVTPESILEAVGLGRGQLDLLDGSPPCFAAGTPVTTLRGVIPIEEVTTGDLVLTHRCRWRMVIGTSSRDAETILVDNRIETTRDHLFLCREQYYFRRDGQNEWGLLPERWLRADSTEGRFCGTPTEIEQYSPAEAPDGFSYSADFWYAIGRWLGDGWLRIAPGESLPRREKKKQHLSAVPCLICGKPSRRHNRYPEQFTNYCSEKCRQKWGRSRKRPRNSVLICTGLQDAPSLKSKLALLGVPIGEHEMRATVRYSISRKSLADWLLRWFRKGCDGKTLPGWTLCMKTEWREALLRGYLDADGSNDAAGGWKAATVSRCLASAVSLLANTLGKTTSLITKRQQEETTVICGRTVNLSPVKFQLQIRDDDCRYTMVRDGIRWRKMRREITSASKLTRVYDIEVDEDHSFVADTFIVHNCASFSTAGKRQRGWGQAKKYSDTTQRTDDLFFEFIRILRGLMPRTFVAENVSGLVKGVAKGTFKEVLAALKESGYRVRCKLLDAQWLGVPQTRQRTIFIGVREDLLDASGNPLQPAHPDPLPYRYSVREAIPWITKIQTGSYCAQWRDSDEPMGCIAQSDGERDHRSQCEVDVTVTNSNVETKHFSSSEPSQTIRAKRAGHLEIVEPETDMTGYASGEALDSVETGGQSKKFFQLYRAPLDGVSQTVTAEGGNPSIASVAHPLQRRKFSIAELRRICAFPDDFVLTGSYAQQWERLGRAVPPVMMSHIARVVRDEILAKVVCEEEF